MDIVERLSEVETGLLHIIFKRLESKEIHNALRVSKIWRDHICTAFFIRSLYSPNPSVSCGAFALQCFFKSRNRADMTEERATIVLDNRLRCYGFDNYGMLGVTSNGLMCTQPRSNSEEMAVYNPSVNKAESFKRERDRKYIDIDYWTRQGNYFRGACFDPATRVFTLIEGIRSLCGQDLLVRLFNSDTAEWQLIPKVLLPATPMGNAVYSWGTFFWRDERGQCVIGYVVGKRKFFKISLLTRDGDDLRSRWGCDWVLRGAEGNVILLSRQVAWRLCRAEQELYEWRVWRNECLSRIYRHSWAYCGDGVHCGVDCCYLHVNSEGWWLAVHRRCWKEQHLVLYNPSGDVVKELPPTQVLSCLPYKGRDPEWDEYSIWPFQINNICWPMA